MSGATKVSADLKAAATAQKAQDNSAAAQATAAAQKDFDSYVGGLSPASAGDYIAIAQAAQALGSSQTESAALANARNAAAAALKALTPKDPCKATKAELDCWAQANMLAQMLGIPDNVDLMKKVNCTQLWSFSMRVIVKNPLVLGRWQLTWSGAIMKVGPGVTITPSPGQPNGGVGVVFGGKLTCGTGNSHSVTTISQSSFRFTVDGTKVGNSFDLTISSPSIVIHSSGVGVGCHLSAQVGNAYAAQLRTLHVTVPVPPGQRLVTFTPANSGGTTTITLRRID